MAKPFRLHIHQPLGLGHKGKGVTLVKVVLLAGAGEAENYLLTAFLANEVRSIQCALGLPQWPSLLPQGNE